MDSVGELFSFLLSQVRAIRPIDVIDILLVAVLLYYVILFFRDRRAGKLAAGVVLLLLALALSNLLQMRAISFILETVVGVGVIALVILFQPELRAMLERMGRGSLSGLGKLVDPKSAKDIKQVLASLCEAAGELASSKTGALIVIERHTKLGDEIRTGTVLDAEVTSQLVRNIFFNKAPLHDGAMILRAGRIYACGCFLPLSQNPDVDRRLGTRHRAALGVSEISDAIVIVVSEETGEISVALDGKLTRGYDRYTLENEIIGLLESEDSAPFAKTEKFFSRLRKKNGGEDPGKEEDK